jgi:hypothetical protein
VSAVACGSLVAVGAARVCGQHRQLSSKRRSGPARGRVIGRFARYRLAADAGVVMLVPVRRGRAAVTLGHDTSLLGPGSSRHRRLRPLEYPPEIFDERGPDDVRCPSLK